MGRPAASGVFVLSDFVANGRQTLHPVSSSPSKIPYGGFSPVRLQTGFQSQPSPSFAGPAYMRSTVLSASPWVAPFGSNRRTVSASRRFRPNIPVQRPLARRRVLLSRRVIAYYGLIRGSGALPTGYVLSRRVFAASGQAPEIPQFKLRVFSSVPFPIPRRIGWRPTVLPPSVGAFALFAGARHPQVSTLIGSCGGSNEAAEFALCCGPEVWLALHRQGRLHSSFHSIESPHWNVEHDYAVNSQLPRPDSHRQDTQPYGLRAKTIPIAS